MELPPPLPPSLCWQGAFDGALQIVDQTLLPHTISVLTLSTAAAVAEAIVALRVRGAPAIGIAGAYGLFLALRQQRPEARAFVETVRAQSVALAATRPTAVNLRWALDRCLARASREPTLAALLDEAQAIAAEDAAQCRRLGEHGAPLVPPGGTVLTHCNTGRLATGGDGTALAVLFAAWRRGVRFAVLADETRPLLQGARLTALELQREGIPVELIVDGAAAGLIARGQVQFAIVGADRIAGNGDFANKVGTYGVALACAAHGVPFWVAAPWSTFDLELPDGRGIPIEERAAAEVLTCAGQRLAAEHVGARNPAFDVTPGRLATGIITDRGILRPPFAPAIKALAAAGR